VADVRERGTNFSSESFDSSYEESAIDLADDGTNGTALGTIASSTVDDVFVPFVGRIVGGVDFSILFLSNRADAAAPSLVAARSGVAAPSRA
jgi:large conductance mechanosensitive channel